MTHVLHVHIHEWNDEKRTDVSVIFRSEQCFQYLHVVCLYQTFLTVLPPHVSSWTSCWTVCRMSKLPTLNTWFRSVAMLLISYGFTPAPIPTAMISICLFFNTKRSYFSSHAEINWKRLYMHITSYIKHEHVLLHFNKVSSILIGWNRREYELRRGRNFLQTRYPISICVYIISPQNFINGSKPTCLKKKTV